MTTTTAKVSTLLEKVRYIKAILPLSHKVITVFVYNTVTCTDEDRLALHLTQMIMLMVMLMMTMIMLIVMLTMMMLMVMLTCWHSISDLRNSKL